MYSDENCFLQLKMEELFTIAASFGKIVHNRGFSPNDKRHYSHTLSYKSKGEDTCVPKSSACP